MKACKFQKVFSYSINDTKIHVDVRNVLLNAREFCMYAFFQYFHLGKKKREIEVLVFSPSAFTRHYLKGGTMGKTIFSVAVWFPKPSVALPKMTSLIFCVITMQAFSIQKSSYCKLECI